MIKKMTQYLLQRRCALSLLLMLMLLQPVMAQTQDPIMYARLNRETQTLTLYYDTKIDDWLDCLIVDNHPLWHDGTERKKKKKPWSLTRVSSMHVPNHVIYGFISSKV